MKRIPLSRNGFHAIVDDGDFELVSRYRWHVVIHRRKDGMARDVYAYRNIYCRKGETHRIQYMHHLVFGETVRLDHRDRNGLNNQRKNLRRCTRTQNSWNAKLRIDNQSGYKGVYAKGERFSASIRIKKKLKHLGYFPSAQEAAAAYNLAASLHFGEFACVNEVSL